MFGFKPLRDEQTEIPTVGEVWITSTGRRYRVEEVDGDRFYVMRLPVQGAKQPLWDEGVKHLWRLNSFRALTREEEKRGI